MPEISRLLAVKIVQVWISSPKEQQKQSKETRRPFSLLVPASLLLSCIILCERGQARILFLMRKPI